MASNIAAGSPQLKVTAQTRIEDLKAFADGTSGRKLLARESQEEGVVLYTAPRSFVPSFMGSALRILLRRQPSPAEALAKDITRNIFMQSLPPKLLEQRKGYVEGYLDKRLQASKGGLTAAAVQRSFERLTDETGIDPKNGFAYVEKFRGDAGSNVGGKSGSTKREADGTFQFKPDIQENPSWLRRLGERFLNVQNVSEVLASAVMRQELDAHEARRADTTLRPPSYGVVTSDAEHAEPLIRAPKVTIVDDEGSRMAVASEYLKSVHGGNLDEYFEKTLGGSKTGEHVKVVIGPEQTSAETPSLLRVEHRPGVIQIQGQAATDLFDHMANTLWLGDHDVNPAKFIVQKDSKGVVRLGCIDLAHSFQNLTQGFGARVTKIRDNRHGNVGNRSENSIVQAVNEKRLRGDFRREGGGLSKIWRDYENLAPSLGLANALKRLAMRPDSHVQALKDAGNHIKGFVEYLEGDPTPDNKAKLETLLKTLAQISEHEGQSVRLVFRKPADVVDEVMNHLTHVLSQRRKEATLAGDLCELQASVNAFYLPRPDGPKVSAEQLKDVLERFENRHGTALLKTRLVWFAESAEAPPFKGTYQQLVNSRKNLAAAQAQARS